MRPQVGLTHTMIIVGTKIRIPRSELRFTFARSSGPGGQNVNKVNSKAVLRWPVTETAALPDDVKAVVVPALAHRLVLRPELWVQRVSAEDVVHDLLVSVPTPGADDVVAEART